MLVGINIYPVPQEKECQKLCFLQNYLLNIVHTRMFKKLEENNNILIHNLFAKWAGDKRGKRHTILTVIYLPTLSISKKLSTNCNKKNIQTRLVYFHHCCLMHILRILSRKPCNVNGKQQNFPKYVLILSGKNI